LTIGPVHAGWFERYDLGCVLDSLRRSFGVQRAVLWGRGVGAASVLLYANGPEMRRAVAEKQVSATLSCSITTLATDTPTHQQNQCLRRGSSSPSW
jgi:hypothetical protein